MSRATDRINGLARKVPNWALYLLATVPIVWMFGLAATGGLGVDPVKRLEHEIGELALQVFIATMAITPLQRYARINLVKFRRALGLIAFFYVLLHLLVWLVLDVQIPKQIWADILKRPYITIGMAAFLLMIPLAITSNNLSIRRMGARAWNRLHWLTYPAILLGALHYVMLVKGWQLEPLIYMAVIIALLITRRIPHNRMQARVSP